MDKRIRFTRNGLGGGITCITAPTEEKIYVIEGKERAMVVDTGTGIGSLLSCIRSFCTLPLIAVNTHGHPDHAGGNAEFEKVYLHPDDRALYYKMVTRRYREDDIFKIFGEEGRFFADNLLDLSENIVPLKEGATFDLGGRKIYVYKISGHTAGSLVFYDGLTGSLFVGDAVSMKDTWLYLDYSTTLQEYRNSLAAFIGLGLNITAIYSGHEPNVARPALLDIRLECLDKILSGEIKGEECRTFAGIGLRAEYRGTSIIYDGARLGK